MDVTPQARSILERLDAELEPPAAPLPNRMLYHYTDAAGLQGIIREGNVWATHYRFMNDRTELTEGRKLVRRACRELLADQNLTQMQRDLVTDFSEVFKDPSINETTRDIFIASFSTKRDDLGQWRAYGNRGDGYAVGVRFTRTSNPEDQAKVKVGAMLVPCEYDRSKALRDMKADLLAALGTVERYATDFREQAPIERIWGNGMTLTLSRLAQHWLRVKNHRFRDEAEWRYVALASSVRRETLRTRVTEKRGLIPYVEIPLSPGKEPPPEVDEIIVGPTHDPKSGVLAAILLLESMDVDPKKAERIVKRSKVPFRG